MICYCYNISHTNSMPSEIFPQVCQEISTTLNNLKLTKQPKRNWMILWANFPACLDRSNFTHETQREALDILNTFILYHKDTHGLLHPRVDVKSGKYTYTLHSVEAGTVGKIVDLEVKTVIENILNDFYMNHPSQF